MRVRGQSTAADLHAEAVQVLLGQTTLEKGTCIDAWRCVALHVDVIAGEAIVFALPKVIEAHVVERRRRCERRKVSANAVGNFVGSDDHGRGVPANEGANTTFDVFVAGEEGLVLRRNGVQVRGPHRGWRADLGFLSAGEKLRHDEARSLATSAPSDGVEGLKPLFRLVWVDVGELKGEVIGHTASSLACKSGNRKLLSMFPDREKCLVAPCYCGEFV